MNRIVAKNLCNTLITARNGREFCNISDFSKAILFCGSFVLLNLCLVFVMLSRLFIAALWSPTGKGLTSWLSFVMFKYVFITFPRGILGQVWCLILLIPDLCHLSYFYFTLSRPIG